MSTITIGLTGMTGAGKSLAASMLRERGFHVIDADEVGHRITDRPQTLKEIKARFGEGVIRPDGSLDRKALGNIVFSDPQKLRVLNSITHPAIREAILREAEETGGAVVIDGALLKECGLDQICDAVIRITAPASVRKKRIMERDGLAADEADRRIAAQTDYSDGWIDVDNSSTAEVLEQNLTKALSEIRGIHEKKKP